MSDLSHVDNQGRAYMVDVGKKRLQRRMARATGTLEMAVATRDMIEKDQIAKGNVLTVAQIAGIQAAKRTAELIPLCHPLTLTHVAVTMAMTDRGATATSEIACVGQTGVEMEALTAVSVALLTVYDMCKAVDKNMRVLEIVLLEKVKCDDDKR